MMGGFLRAGRWKHFPARFLLVACSVDITIAEWFDGSWRKLEELIQSHGLGRFQGEKGSAAGCDDAL